MTCLTYAGNLSTLKSVMDNPNFRFVKASITDREAVFKLFEEEHPDIVVNFAAESHVDRSIENPERVPCKQTFMGTQTTDGRLLEVRHQAAIIRSPQTRSTAISP